MESGFSTQDIEIIFASDLSCAKLLKPVDYIARNGTRYRAPYMASTDFASTPSAMWGAPLFLIPTGWWALPALFHDCAFRNNLLVVLPDGSSALANLSEAQSNDLLCEMMQAIKPQPTDFESIQMHAIFEGVTLGGWHAFSADRK